MPTPTTFVRITAQVVYKNSDGSRLAVGTPTFHLERRGNSLDHIGGIAYRIIDTIGFALSVHMTLLDETTEEYLAVDIAGMPIALDTALSANATRKE